MPKARKIFRRTLPSPAVPIVPAADDDRLLGDIRALIEVAREQTARVVNSAMAGLYWHIGKRIREDILGEKRADYGVCDCFDAVETIDRGVWARFRTSQLVPDDPVC